MGFLDRFNKQENIVPETIVVNDAMQSIYEIMSMKFDNADMPKIVESKNSDWVLYGKDNNYSSVLIDLYNSCPMHQSIVNRKSMMVAGSGFTFSTPQLDPLNTTILENFFKSVDGEKSLKEFVDLISFDFKLFGSYAIECVWSLDFKKVIKVKWLDVTKIRCGKETPMGEIENFYYSKDWTDKRCKPVKLPKFDTNNKESYNQLLYVRNKRPGVEYYGSPDYVSGLNWISLDAAIGIYHKSNMENGFQPSFAIKFYKKPNSPEERQNIFDGLKQNFGGKRNVGKAMVFFSDGKELAPDITPIEVSNIDKQFTVITEQVINQVLTAHSVVSGELFGISVPGIGTTDLEISYNIFQNTVIRPDQMTIENSLNKILGANGININLRIIPFSPLDIVKK